MRPAHGRSGYVFNLFGTSRSLSDRSRKRPNNALCSRLEDVEKELS